MFRLLITVFVSWTVCMTGRTVVADDGRFYVEFFAGGKLDERKGPFESAEAAQDWARAQFAANRDDLRPWRVVDEKDLKAAGKGDEPGALDGQTIKDILALNGTPVDDGLKAVEKLRKSFQKEIDDAKAKVQTLRDRFTSLEKWADKNQSAQFKSLNDAYVPVATQLARGRQQAELNQMRVNASEKLSRTKTNARNKILDELLGTKDPIRRKELLDELERLRKSKNLRDSIISEGRFRNDQDREKASNLDVTTLEQSLDKNLQQQEDILASLSQKMLEQSQPKVAVEEPENAPAEKVDPNVGTWVSDTTDQFGIHVRQQMQYFADGSGISKQWMDGGDYSEYRMEWKREGGKFYTRIVGNRTWNSWVDMESLGFQKTE